MSEAVEITHEPENSRFLAQVDGQVAGFAAYRDREGVRVFTSTVTEPAMRGRGVAGTLVEAAFADTVEADLAVDPQCSYVAKYLDDHPEWQQRLRPA